jgi:pimeloyl-ACP methyl ester carboxylesterase
MWAEHLGPLSESGRRVMALDLPGFGDAPVPPGEQAAWLDVLETMDSLEIDRATLVGCSFGAEVAMRVAVTAPERVEALALFSASSPDADPSPRLEAVWQAEEEALERGDLEAAVEAVLDAWILPDADPRLRERIAAMQQRAFERQREAEPGPDAVDPLEQDPGLVSSLPMPTLVAAGERDMSDFLDGAHALAAAMPNATVTVIEGAGHLPPLETPEAFRSILSEFLD